MAISDEITRLQGAKSALKTAIEGKGVTVSSSAKLDAYPALVDSIEAGGGSIEDLITKENLVRIETLIEGANITLDVSNNFTANDVFISTEFFRKAKLTFQDITIQVGDISNSLILYTDTNKHIVFSINDINIEVQKYSSGIIYFYLNNEIIGTVNYDD